MSHRAIITTPDHVTLEFELAGAGSRLMAWCLDSLVILLLFLALFFILMGIGLGTALGLNLDHGVEELISSVGVAILTVIYFVVSWGYGLVFETATRGQTLGKRWMGLRVIRDDGLPIGLREAATRNLVRAADMMPPPLYLIGGLVLNFDRQHRRLGDMVAGTLVIQEQFEVKFGSKLSAVYAARLEQGQSRQAVNLPGGTLSVKQLDLLEQYLSRRDQLNPARRAALARTLGEPLIGLLGLDAEAFRKQSDPILALEKLMRQVLEQAQQEAPSISKPSPTTGLF